MVIRYYFFTLFFAFFGTVSLGQDIPPDSTSVNLLNAKQKDTTLVNRINFFAQKNTGTNSGLAIKYSLYALAISKKLKYVSGTLNSLIVLGTTYYNQGNYAQSLEYLLQAMKLSEKEKEKKWMAIFANWLGNVYSMHENTRDQAETYYLQSLKLGKEINFEKGITECLSNLGGLYRVKGKFQKSLDCYFQALNIDEKLNNKKSLAATFNNIGNVYKDINDYAKAGEYFTKALRFFEVLGDQEGTATVLLNLGDLYNEEKQYNKAFISFEKALKKFNAINIRDGEMTSYEALAQSSYLMKNYQNAYQYHQRYSQIKDSLFNEESSKQIQEMSSKYESEKKEQQIKLLNKDKQIQQSDLKRQKLISYSVIGGLVIVLLFSLVLINRFLFIRKQKKVIESEREKSDKLLLNILPKDTADELKLTGKAHPKYYEMATVMFTDFKGFTTLAEKMSAEELVGELDFIFKKYDEIISSASIEKIKTIGDSYMCAGGLPVANKTNPMDVVLAALEIQRFMNEYKLKRISEGKQFFEVRIGVHTGAVVAGVVGDKKFAYDIWGDAVNTASRMESSGEAGKVNISGDTYQILKSFSDNSHPSPFGRGAGDEVMERLNFTYRGKIPAKNKGEVEMYFVEQV